MNIFVGNLDYKVNENDLQELFEEFGSVNEVKIIKDKYSGRSKGFGFITMNDASEGQQAITKLNGGTFENRKMVVNEALEKKENNNRSSY
jgi:RNA recognition motif-containing protein